jgi:hypothetical protein
VASVVDVDRFFRDKDLEELTRKTYDNMGLEVRDVLVKSDLAGAQATEESGRSLEERGRGRGHPASRLFRL